MAEFSFFHDQIAAHQIRERVASKQRSRVPGRPRYAGRRAIARQLHSLADRLDR